MYGDLVLGVDLHPLSFVLEGRLVSLREYNVQRPVLVAGAPPQVDIRYLGDLQKRLDSIAPEVIQVRRLAQRISRDTRNGRKNYNPASSESSTGEVQEQRLVLEW